ncbi:MAG: hypothetical protein ACT4OZ_15155 [Gemmatimonadota bacterium]
MADPEDVTSAWGIDLTKLRQMWAVRRAAAESVRQRVVLSGLRRPARDPDERAWLEERRESLFVEDEHAGALARAYYERKYSRPAD